jgi:hypothetical protein
VATTKTISSYSSPSGHTVEGVGTKKQLDGVEAANFGGSSSNDNDNDSNKGVDGDGDGSGSGSDSGDSKGVNGGDSGSDSASENSDLEFAIAAALEALLAARLCEEQGGSAVAASALEALHLLPPLTPPTPPPPPNPTADLAADPTEQKAAQSTTAEQPAPSLPTMLQPNQKGDDDDDDDGAARACVCAALDAMLADVESGALQIVCLESSSAGEQTAPASGVGVVVGGLAATAAPGIQDVPPAVATRVLRRIAAKRKWWGERKFVVS